MKMKTTVLTREERDILILAALHPNAEYLSNSEIAQRLGVSINRVKTILHRACVKLDASNRGEAILFAIKRGDINLTEFWSVDEVAGLLRSLSPDTLIRIAHLVGQEVGHGNLSGKDEQIVHTDRRQNTVLTKRERDVLILAGHGLTNKEIADRLCMSIGSVKIFLNRACTKLGARKRADAFVLALKQREIGLDEIYTLDEMAQYLAPFGAESIKKMAQLLSQEPGQEPTPTSS
jgi:DNA-binding CsgD family transcriptional regulator